jgi:SAM-dependent methyltransferase
MEDRWTGLEPGQRPFREAAPFYAEYRYKPSEEFARLLATHLGWSRDDRVLDLGAGPGHVSTLLAPYVGEVVVMEPDEAMLDEGRSQAASAGVENLSFVLGGSDDLPRLKSSVGEFASVVISQAFHWMRDQASVLRTLSEVVDRRRGAVALIGYVNGRTTTASQSGSTKSPGAKPRRSFGSIWNVFRRGRVQAGVMIPSRTSWSDRRFHASNYFRTNTKSKFDPRSRPSSALSILG